MKFAEVLTAEQVQRVHEASLWVLENVGILAHNPKARAVFKAHGCSVGDDGLVTFPPAVVERHMKVVPPQLHLPRSRPRVRPHRSPTTARPWSPAARPPM